MAVGKPTHNRTAQIILIRCLLDLANQTTLSNALRHKISLFGKEERSDLRRRTI